MARGLRAELGSAARLALADVLTDTALSARMVLALSGKFSCSHRERCVPDDDAVDGGSPITVDADANECGMGRVAQSWLGTLALESGKR